MLQWISQGLAESDPGVFFGDGRRAWKVVRRTAPDVSLPGDTSGAVRWAGIRNPAEKSWPETTQGTVLCVA